jgi:electron transfer flavoprotein alpha subunit
MAGIFIFSDKKDLAAELIAFAKQARREAILLCLGEPFAQQLKNAGADKIVVIKGSSELIESYAQSIAALIEQEVAELFLVGATPRGRDLAARVAGFLDCAMVSDVSAVSYDDGKLTASRTLYGGSVQQIEEIDGLSVVTIPSGKFEPIKGEAKITFLELEADKRVSLVEISPIVKQGADLSVAEKVVCVGLGMDKEEDMQMARDLADVIGAEIGCTRGITEERHWLPVDHYIGISGAIVKPKLYISLGVSGQIQHVYGIRDSQIIVAVDMNENAPIFKAADYGIVGDMYEIIPALIEGLKK